MAYAPTGRALAVGTTTGVDLLDPSTGAPFPGNIIPTSRLSPQSLTFLQFVAQPNAQGSGAAHGAGGAGDLSSKIPQATKAEPAAGTAIRR